MLWTVLLANCGRELARVPLPAPASRGDLPLRDLAGLGLRHDVAALLIVRHAADAQCRPCRQELDAIERARRTLGAIGLRLHDYILWHGECCVSLRAAGLL